MSEKPREDCLSLRSANCPVCVLIIALSPCYCCVLGRRFKEKIGEEGGLPPRLESSLVLADWRAGCGSSSG